MNPHFRPALFIALVTLAADQLSKYLLLQWLHLDTVEPIVITSFFRLVAVWNRGISFGMFNHESNASRVVLLVIAGAITFVLYHWLKRANDKTVSYALGMVMGGALGNMVDRVVYGAVFDFLDVHAYHYHWPAFNLADSAICIGVTLLCIDSLLLTKKEKA